jgi:hypothetical protein
MVGMCASITEGNESNKRHVTPEAMTYEYESASIVKYTP